jgi:integrase
LAIRAYLIEWIDRYQGTGRRGFRENTRAEYRRLLDNYCHRYFSDRLRLVDITPHALARFVAWLTNDHAQGRHLADTTIRNIVMPVRAALATAQREGLIRQNPAQGLALPHRPALDAEEPEEVRPLSRGQLAALVSMVPTTYRLLVELVASTGLRISEALALQRRDLTLSGGRPYVRVRRAIVKGVVGPPKSRHGRRTVLIPPPLADRLRVHLDGLDPRPEQWVFPSQRNTPLNPDNLRRRMLKPLLEEVGVPWAGWHALRHTYASIQLSDGVNIVALSRALGHHSAAFTLSRYVHVLEGDEAPALDVTPDEDARSSGATVGQRTPPNVDELDAVVPVDLSNRASPSEPDRT